MNESYVILTESSCDLSTELVDQAGVEVLPLSFTMEGKNYHHYPDGRDFPWRNFTSGCVAVRRRSPQPPM